MHVGRSPRKKEGIWEIFSPFPLLLRGIFAGRVTAEAWWKRGEHHKARRKNRRLRKRKNGLAKVRSKIGRP